MALLVAAIIGSAGFTVGWGSLAGIAVVAAVVGSVVAVVVDKRRRDLVELYKGLYEGKSSEVQELNERLTRAEAQIALFQSDFTRHMAEGVTEAIVRIMETRYPSPPGGP